MTRANFNNEQFFIELLQVIDSKKEVFLCEDGNMYADLQSCIDRTKVSEKILDGSIRYAHITIDNFPVDADALNDLFLKCDFGRSSEAKSEPETPEKISFKEAKQRLEKMRKGKAPEVPSK